MRTARFCGSGGGVWSQRGGMIPEDIVPGGMVLGVHGPLPYPPPVNRLTDRCVKTLPSRNFVGGR